MTINTGYTVLSIKALLVMCVYGLVVHGDLIHVHVYYLEELELELEQDGDIS